MAKADDRQRPTVLFGIGGLEAGGSESQLCDLVCRVHGREIDAVVFVAVAHSGRLLERLRDAGVPVLEAGPARLPRWVRALVLVPRLWRALGRADPDVVYSWLEEASVILVPLARMRGMPVVVARRNIAGARVERFPLVGRIIRRAERGARLVTANSNAVLEQAEQRGIGRAQLRLVPNSLAERAPRDPPPAPPVRLGYLARMRPEKGHKRLFSVLSRLPPDLQWTAKLGGAGPLLDQTKADAARLGLLDRVHFCGEVSDPSDFWDDCHIGMLLSDHEGSPNSLLEAARAARPLFATAVGGNREIVVEAAGLLVDPEDDERAAATLAGLIADAALRARYASGAREVALTRHDPGRVAASHVAVLMEAAAPPAA